jgi:AraC-like DNA-binding protein
VATFDADQLHVRICHFGRASLWPWWRLDIRTSHWVLWNDDHDGAAVIAGRRRWALRAGRVMVLPPGTPIVTVPAPGVSQVYLHVELLGLSAEAAGILAPGPVDLGDDPILAAQAGALHRALGDVRAGAAPGEHIPFLALPARAFVFQALARLIAIAAPATREALTDHLRHSGPLAPAIHHIEAHLGEALYVDALARLCGMGSQWFTRQLRQATGLPPARYILDRRTAMAAQLLAHGDDPIETIAARCGFSDRAHFTRVFTRLRGLPPARYRVERQARPGSP